MNFIFLGAQEQEVWKSFIPAIGSIVAALITTIGVIWTARSSLKKLKIDQKATPTELTRYKEWLEIAEKYKNVYVKSVPYGPGADYGGQWDDIKRSCEAALHAASWERIVLSETPKGRAQKKLLKLDSNYVASMFIADNSRIKKVPNFSNTVYYVIFGIILTFLMMFFILCILASIVLFFGGFLEEGLSASVLVLVLLLVITPSIGLFYSITGEVLTEVYFRKVADSYQIQLDASEKIDRKKRIKASFWNPELENYIIFPKRGGFRKAIYRFWISFYTSSKTLENYGYIYFEKPESVDDSK